MVQVNTILIILCLKVDIPPNQNEKMIWYLDSAYQNSWKALYSSSHMLSYNRN